MDKGNINVQVILLTFVAIIVGVILFQVIAQTAGTSTNTVSVDVNVTVGANGETYTFTDYKALNSVTITNATGGETIAEGNYTITNNVVSNGALTTTLTVDDAEYESSSWNVVATGEPLTYINESGSRAMVNLIVIFFALMLVAVALYPVYESKLMDMFGR